MAPEVAEALPAVPLEAARVIRLLLDKGSVGKVAVAMGISEHEVKAILTSPDITVALHQVAGVRHLELWAASLAAVERILANDDARVAGSQVKLFETLSRLIAGSTGIQTPLDPQPQDDTVMASLQRLLPKLVKFEEALRVADGRPKE